MRADRANPMRGADIDAEIGEARALIAQALAAHRRETAAVQRQTELWQRRYEARLKGSGRVIRKMASACLYAGSCLESADRLRAAAFVCQDIESILAAHTLATDDAIIVVDVVEAPFYRVRWDEAGGTGDPLVFALDRATAGLLSLADIAMAASNGLGDELQNAGVPAIFLPDYPEQRAFDPTPGIREACGLAATDGLALLFDRVDEGFRAGPIVAALGHLDASWHMAIIGDRFDACGTRYREELGRYLAASGFGERVHLLPPVASQILPSFAGGAEVGVIGLDPDHIGERLLLPGSLFECLAARLPVAVGDLPEIRRALDPYSAASSQFDRRAPHSIAASIETLAQAKDRLHPALDAAACGFVWTRNERALLAPLSGVGAVTMLRAQSIPDCTRTNRIAATLLDHGIEVTIAAAQTPARGGAEKGPPAGVAGASYVDMPIDIGGVDLE